MSATASDVDDKELAALSKEVIGLLQQRNSQSDKKERKRDKKHKDKQREKEAKVTPGLLPPSEPQPEVEISGKDSEGLPYFNITEKRRAKIQKFKGKARVDLREYYQGGDGELLPGKKGISLSLEDYQRVKELIPAIDRELARMGAKPSK